MSAHKFISPHRADIEHLARELVSAAGITEPARPSFSSALLRGMTALATLGSSVIAGLGERTYRPLNRYEQVELEALAFYAAHLIGSDEMSLRHEAALYAGVDDFDDLTKGEFAAARTFLHGKII